MITEKDIVATMEDLIPAGVCPSGMRRWAEARGWDFRDLVNGGVKVQELRDTGCPYAARVADAAERRVAGGAA